MSIVTAADVVQWLGAMNVPQPLCDAFLQEDIGAVIKLVTSVFLCARLARDAAASVSKILRVF